MYSVLNQAGIFRLPGKEIERSNNARKNVYKRLQGLCHE